MQSQSLISLWRQRFTCGSYALALVGSLALYHKTVLTNPTAVAQSRREGNATINPKGIRMESGLAGISFGSAVALKLVPQVKESYFSWGHLLATTKFNSSP